MGGAGGWGGADLVRTIEPTLKVSPDGHSEQTDPTHRRYRTPTPTGHFAMHGTPFDFVQAAGAGPTDAADQRRVTVRPRRAGAGAR